MSLNNSTALNCYPLLRYTSFEQYVEAIFNVTGGDLDRVDVCKAEVCSAIWGTGNADISGSGVSLNTPMWRVES